MQASYLQKLVPLLCRYLYRHNYTISLPELYGQINRPDTQSFYVSTLSAYETTVTGSDENWVDYLKTCKSSSCVHMLSLGICMQ